MMVVVTFEDLSLSLSLSLSLVFSSKDLKGVCDDGCKIGKLGL
jgi:hypothetical protein